MALSGTPEPLATRPFEALFFDLGNTLIYFDGDWVEVLLTGSAKLANSLQESGLEIDKQLVAKEFFERFCEKYSVLETDDTEITTSTILKMLLEEKGYSNVPQASIRTAIAAFYSVSQEHWHVEKDTIPVLANLKRYGYKLAILSNAGDDDDIQTLVDKAGIRPFFDLILSSADFGIRKPSPLIFEWALSKLKVDHTQVVMIGDTLGADILGAKNANLFSIFLTRRADTLANQAQVNEIKPDAVIHTLSELPDLLNNLYLRKNLRTER